jgi:hypothetical protein
MDYELWITPTDGGVKHGNNPGCNPGIVNHIRYSTPSVIEGLNCYFV